MLQLRRDKLSEKYYIASQNDLYQVDQFTKFVAPGGFVFVFFWQIVATLVCLFAAVVFWPISWIEEHGVGLEVEKVEVVTGPEGEASLEQPKGGGVLVTAPAVQQR